MKVKMKKTVACADYAYSEGQIVDVSDELGVQFCAEGDAEPVKAPKVANETAEAPKTEEKADQKPAKEGASLPGLGKKEKESK